jgi:hypothetical protein
VITLYIPFPRVRGKVPEGRMGVSIEAKLCFFVESRAPIPTFPRTRGKGSQGSLLDCFA